LGGGLVSAVIGLSSYVGLHLLILAKLPDDDFESLVSSGFAATAVGSVGAGILASVSTPFLERLLGYVSRSRLQELADLDQQLLKRLASEAPGTWQHSLAVANLCEMAANAVGGNGLLCRVGALYHDVGKIRDPKYFIENLTPGEPNPHDGLSPEASASTIAAHCEEGVKLAKQARLPGVVIDFIQTHHGDGVIEYFWEKYRRQTNGNKNPAERRLTEKDFRYPGVPPQSRETAILALCDAVEAASRTLKGKEDRKAVENLVEHIFFTKLRTGQLDSSGLSAEELKKIADVLVESLSSALHVRVEYPWQQEAKQATSPATEIVPSQPQPMSEGVVSVPVAVSAPVSLSGPAPASPVATMGIQVSGSGMGPTVAVAMNAGTQGPPPAPPQGLTPHTPDHNAPQAETMRRGPVAGPTLPQAEPASTPAPVAAAALSPPPQPHQPPEARLTPLETSPATVTLPAAEGEVEFEYGSDAMLTTTAKIEVAQSVGAVPTARTDTPSGRIAIPTEPPPDTLEPLKKPK